MQESFRWNTATIKANTAGVQFLIDKRNHQAQIGGKKGGGVPARSAAYDCNVQLRSVDHRIFLTLDRKQEWLLESLYYPAEEPHSISTVYQSVVVRKRQRQHEPRFEIVVHPNGFRA